MSILELRDASVVRGGRTILDSVSLRLRTGDFLAIVGPNGSGKSTLLRTIAGLWQATSEEAAQLDGRWLQNIPRIEIARRISFVPQDTHIDFAFTVDEIVRMGRYPHRGRFARETMIDRAAVESALQKCDVVHLRNRAVNTLSGGERQRASIARSLAVEPDFILLDEPMANLDIEHSLGVLTLCRRLAADGHAVILTSHDLNAVSRYSSKVALMHHGRIQSIGPCEQVLSTHSIKEVFRVTAETLYGRNGQPFYVFHKSDDGKEHTQEV
jgi:iron complex transport system ATP-binding protein